jgi:hypothetical protein
MSNVTRLPLSYTFRCPKAVVAEANAYAPELEAAPTNIEGEVLRATLPEFWKTFIPEISPSDAILCRNTAPLVELAFQLIRKGIGCKVEGRDIGAQLAKFVKRFKSARTLDQLVDAVLVYQEKEVAKLLEKEQNEVADRLNDRCETVLVLVDAVRSTPGYRASLNGLQQYIDDLFGDTKEDDEGKPILTLSTVHKAKGREWPTVFILGANRYMPSPFARQDWQQGQEDNLIYVAITRAQERLVWVEVPLKGE